MPTAPPAQVPMGLKGRPVSSLEEVRAAQIDFDGSIIATHEKNVIFKFDTPYMIDSENNINKISIAMFSTFLPPKIK